MHDFKVGDRVEYVGPSEDILALSPFLIAGFYGSGNTQYVKIKGIERYEPLVSNLRHITPAPDVITINRAALPEVVERDGKFFAGSGPEECMARGSENPNWLRNHANSALALAEFLEAREKAAEEAKAKLDKRRDELAKEVAKSACYVNYQNFTYEDHVPAAQSAINMLIELDPGHA